MYQTVIRDPGGSDIIRIVPDVCSSRAAVVNGSILLVPAGTIAFVVLNGQISCPYGPGRYELFTGVDPFFVNLRNAMTRGDPGISVSIFYISTRKEKFLQMGTGEIPFCERRFQLTMHALASCNLTFTVSDPRKLLEKMIGAYSTNFSEYDLEPCLKQLVLTPVREALARELVQYSIVQFNSSLTAISAKVSGAVAATFADYGLQLVRFALTGINIPAAEMQRMYQHEQAVAEGRIRIGEEKDLLNEIWGGDLEKRTRAEILTGISARGGQPCANTQHGGGSNEIASAIAQTMLLTQLLPMLQDPLNTMSQHTDLFGGTRTTPNQNTTSADAPRPLPGKTRRCPVCKGSVPREAVSCPICSHRF